MLEDAVLTLMVAATLGSGSGPEPEPRPAAAGAGVWPRWLHWARRRVWQAVADLPPLGARAGASNSESDSVSPLCLSPVPGSRERGLPSRFSLSEARQYLPVLFLILKVRQQMNTSYLLFFYG